LDTYFLNFFFHGLFFSRRTQKARRQLSGSFEFSIFMISIFLKNSKIKIALRGAFGILIFLPQLLTSPFEICYTDNVIGLWSSFG
jgi:hypothetical protein